MSSAAARVRRVTVGFVVRQETKERDPGNSTVVHTTRKDDSRIYHSRSAAETHLAMCQKQTPEGVFFVHEKTKRDDAELLS